MLIRCKPPYCYYDKMLALYIILLFQPVYFKIFKMICTLLRQDICQNNRKLQIPVNRIWAFLLFLFDVNFFLYRCGLFSANNVEIATKPVAISDHQLFISRFSVRFYLSLSRHGHSFYLTIQVLRLILRASGFDHGVIFSQGMTIPFLGPVRDDRFDCQPLAPETGCRADPVYR